ncbi:MAG: hypothetical protein V4568_07830 [Pseudomonadota bacterium]
MNRRARWLVAGIVLLTVTEAALAADEPAVTPYRPSVSAPANLSEPGWLEAEFGWQHIDGGDAARRDSLPLYLEARIFVGLGRAFRR